MDRADSLGFIKGKGREVDVRGDDFSSLFSGQEENGEY